jgi:hypothetical protein
VRKTFGRWLRWGALLALSVMGVSARAGTRDSGGDPMTQEFLTLAENLAKYFVDYQAMLNLPFPASAFAAKVRELDASIKNESVPDKIEFTDAVLRDRDGVEKSAVFNQDTGLIRVNRTAWSLFSDRQRLVQVTLEIGGLLKVPLRYETADRLVGDSAEALAGDACAPPFPAAYDAPESVAEVCAELHYSASRCEELRAWLAAQAHRRAPVCDRYP